MLKAITLALATSASLIFGAAVAISGSLPPLAPEERKELPAVGLIKAVGPDGVVVCTGTLVAKDLVITSAHCTNRYTGLMNNIEFIAGLNGTRFVANSGAAEIIQHPNWTSASGLKRHRYDVAILRLARPISTDRVRPIDVFPAHLTLPKSGALLGYKSTNTEMLHGSFDCSLSPRSPNGLIASDCPATKGNSGGAVLAEGKDGWQLVGVIVASARINSNALVVALDDWLRSHVKDAHLRDAKRTALAQ
ncbi:MAG: trypsin-like serine protease [Pseudomonadota bacterium]